MKLCTSVGVAAALALALGGCEQKPAAEAGQLPDGRKVSAAVMNLLLPDNSQITEVSFHVTGPGSFDRHGTVNVNNSSKVKFRVGDIPVNTSTPYEITIGAETTDHVSCAGGPSSFLVNNNNVVSVTMSLICDSDVDNAGDVVVNADVHGNCPAILGITALPAEAYVGSDMSLHVDHTAGSTGVVMWTVDAGGSFSSASDEDTGFTCLLAGTHTVTVTLSEGPAECTTHFDAEVECTDGGIDLALCGDHELDPGEDCDEGNTVTPVCDYGQQSCEVCSAGCQLVQGATSYCGDDVPSAPEQCDDGSLNTAACAYGLTSCTVCNTSCLSVAGTTSYCGDGTIDLTHENCEDSPPNAATESCDYGVASCTVCDASCHDVAGAVHVCGDSNTDTAAGETCDDGNTTAGDGCDAACHSEAATGPGTGIAHGIAACAACRQSNCTDVDFSGINALDRCFTSPDGSQSPADAQLCVDVLDCAYTHNCAYSSTGLDPCWCTGSPAVCQIATGTASLETNQGPCFDEILAASQAALVTGGACTTDADCVPTPATPDCRSGVCTNRTAQLNQAMDRYSVEIYPSGAAFWMLSCDRASCDAECTP